MRENMIKKQEEYQLFSSCFFLCVKGGLVINYHLCLFVLAVAKF